MKSVAKHTERNARVSSRAALGLLVGLLAFPALGAAQGTNPAARLSGRVPADVEAAVLERLSRTDAMGLPDRPMVDLVLQGVAKGRSAPEVLAALDGFVADLGRARAALSGFVAPTAEEVEAAGIALRMGVDGGTISSLARSRPEGRSLEIPLLVLGGLTQRGLPSDQALGRVAERLAARVDDAGLLAELPLAAGGPNGGRPAVTPPAGPFGPGGQGLPGAAGGSSPGIGPQGSGRPVGPPSDGRPGRGGPGVPGGG